MCSVDLALVAELYVDAAAVEKLLGLLVIKNGQLVAEGYFNRGSRERKALLQSVTKSYASALVGIALDRGCLSSIGHKMLEFFPKRPRGSRIPGSVRSRSATCCRCAGATRGRRRTRSCGRPS